MTFYKFITLVYVANEEVLKNAKCTLSFSLGPLALQSPKKISSLIMNVATYKA